MRSQGRRTLEHNGHLRAVLVELGPDGSETLLDAVLDLRDAIWRWGGGVRPSHVEGKRRRERRARASETSTREGRGGREEGRGQACLWVVQSIGKALDVLEDDLERDLPHAHLVHQAPHVGTFCTPTPHHNSDAVRASARGSRNAHRRPAEEGAPTPPRWDAHRLPLCFPRRSEWLSGWPGFSWSPSAGSPPRSQHRLRARAGGVVLPVRHVGKQVQRHTPASGRGQARRTCGDGHGNATTWG